MEVAARAREDLLLDRLDELERRRREIDAEMLEAVAELDEVWPDDPTFPDLCPELAHRWQISQQTAWERIRIGTALRALPALMAAPAGGNCRGTSSGG